MFRLVFEKISILRTHESQSPAARNEHSAIETSGCVAAGPRGRSVGDLQGCALWGREGAPGSDLPMLLLWGIGAAPGALLVPSRSWEGAEGLRAAGWRQDREGAGGCGCWQCRGTTHLPSGGTAEPGAALAPRLPPALVQFVSSPSPDSSVLLIFLPKQSCCFHN